VLAAARGQAASAGRGRHRLPVPSAPCPLCMVCAALLDCASGAALPLVGMLDAPGLTATAATPGPACTCRTRAERPAAARAGSGPARLQRADRVRAAAPARALRAAPGQQHGAGDHQRGGRRPLVRGPGAGCSLLPVRACHHAAACCSCYHALSRIIRLSLPRNHWLTARARAGSVLLSILTWLVSPVVLGCLAVLLAFWLIVAQGQRARFRREKSKLRSEFDSYRREMQAKARRPAPEPCCAAHAYPAPNPNGHVQALCQRASSSRLASWHCHAQPSMQDSPLSVQRACVQLLGGPQFASWPCVCMLMALARRGVGDALARQVATRSPAARPAQRRWRAWQRPHQARLMGP